MTTFLTKFRVLLYNPGCPYFGYDKERRMDIVAANAEDALTIARARGYFEMIGYGHYNSKYPATIINIKPFVRLS